MPVPNVPPSPPAEPSVPIADQVREVVSGGPEAWWPLLGGLAHALLNLAIGAGILIVTIWVAGWASRLAREALGRLNHSTQPDTVLRDFVGSLVRYAVIIIGGIAVLQQIGVQTTSVLAVLGAASLAIGLALQGGLSNVAAGVMLLFLRPYRIGDQVQIAGTVGKVRALDLFITRLNDLDNCVVFIPNSKALGDIIVNYSMPDSRRIVLEFGIDYDDDVDLALGLLIETAKADPRVVAEPPPWAKLTSMNDSTVTVTLRAWTAPNSYLDTRFDLMKAVKARFQSAGLNFAYPHQVSVEGRPFSPPDLDAQRGFREALEAKREAADIVRPAVTPSSATQRRRR